MDSTKKLGKVISFINMKGGSWENNFDQGNWLSTYQFAR